MMAPELSPVDIGLPPHFSHFRPAQWEAIEFALYSPQRFVAMCLPTGSGKSITARAIALLTRQRCAIVTSTKGLADQYQSDFGPTRLHTVGRRILGSVVMGDVLYDIRGKGNYQCVDKRHVMCDDGAKVGCGKQPGTTCPYHSALSDARHAMCSGTNYAFWMNINRKGKGLSPIIGAVKPIEVLILDEAHTAPEELVKFLAVRIGEKEVKQVLGTTTPGNEDIEEWVEWARPWGKWCAEEVKEQAAKMSKQPWSKAQHSIGDLRKLESLGKRLTEIADRVREQGWVCEEKQHYSSKAKTWEFEPVWPGQYAQQSLFCNVPKVILISATIRRKTMGVLGVKGHEMAYREWPRVFPKSRNQVYHYPTIRMNWRTTQTQMKEWVEGIDRILDSRGKDRKGLIHTVSYDRQSFLMTHSRHRKWFIGNTDDPNSETAAEVVKKFRAAQAPCVLVSPSFATGWDFPGTDCEFIIIGKIPWPNIKTKVMKERMKRDPNYAGAIAMQDLVQMAGRGMRFELDRCEVFIVDDVGFFMYQNKQHAPAWFEVRKLAKGDGGTGLVGMPPLPVKL